MTSIDHMTANQITAEIAELAKLERTGDITAAQSDRLEELRYRRRRMGAQARGRWL